MNTFHQSLADICKEAAHAAEASDDRREGFADMLTELSAMLGRTIAFAADGRPDVIATLISDCTNNCAQEAQETANSLRLALTKTEGSA